MPIVQSDAAARAAWLGKIAQRDAALAGDLRVILAEHDAVHQAGFMDVPVIDPRMALAGQEVGAYRLVSLIGQGGTGSVWLAERADGRGARPTSAAPPP